MRGLAFSLTLHEACSIYDVRTIPSLSPLLQLVHEAAKCHTFVCWERPGVQRHLAVRDLSVCCHDVEVVSHSTSYLFKLRVMIEQTSVSSTIQSQVYFAVFVSSLT